MRCQLRPRGSSDRLDHRFALLVERATFVGVHRLAHLDVVLLPDPVFWSHWSAVSAGTKVRIPRPIRVWICSGFENPESANVTVTGSFGVGGGTRARSDQAL